MLLLYIQRHWQKVAGQPTSSSVEMPMTLRHTTEDVVVQHHLILSNKTHFNLILIYNR